MRKFTFIRWTLTSIAVASSVLLCSCASSNRMMRLSPFRSKRHYDSLKSGGVKLTEKSIVQFDRPTGRNNFAERFQNRVNIWPFLYKEGNFTSAMWPFIDMDPYGIAIRPFYNHEGNEYSVMFPLSAWNPVKGDGWAALYYWNRSKGIYGTAPFFHIKYDGDAFRKYLILGGLLNHYSVRNENHFSFSLLNYLQSRNGTKSFNTFIPLYLYKTRSNSWSLWALPTIYNSWREVKVHKLDELVKENHYTSAFLPLYYYKYKNADDYWLWVLNSYYNRQNDNRAHAFMPLYLYNKAGNNSLLQVLLWIQKDRKNSASRTIFPLWHCSYSKDNSNSYHISPLYFYKRKGENDKILWALNFIYRQDGDDTGQTMLPLYFYRNKAEKDKTLWILNFIYRQDGDDTVHTMLPLYFYQNKAEKDQTLWALNFLYNKKDDVTGNMVFPLYLYKSNPAKQKEYLLILGGLLGHYNLNKNQKSFSILNFYKDDNNHALIPLYWYNSENGKHLNVLGLSGLSYEHDELQKLYALPLFWYERNSTLWAFPYFQRHTSSRYYNGILPIYTYKETPFINEVQVYPLLSSFKTGKDYYSGNIFFPFGGYNIKQNSSSSYFWPLYNYKTGNQDIDADGPFLFKYMDCSYYPPFLSNTFSSEDGKKAEIPANIHKSFNLLLFGYEEENRHILNYGKPDFFIPNNAQQNETYKSGINAFPFFATTRKEQRWDFSKIKTEVLKQINHEISEIKLADLFEFNFHAYKRWTKGSSSRSSLKQQLKDRFKLKLDLNKPLLPQLKSNRKIMMKRKDNALANLYSILQRNSCKIKDASKSEILKGLYELQQKNCYDYTTEKYSFFPVSSWNHSPDSWNWWFILAYANRTKGTSYNQFLVNQIVEGKIHKLPSNDSFKHGFFPIYNYSSDKDNSSCIILPLLSRYKSYKKEPDCGFPEKVFGQAMKDSGLKPGKKTTGNWMILFKTESEYADSVLPVPEKSSGKAITQKDKQIFWLYDNWHEEYKYWDYEKVKQAELKKIMTAVATLIDLDYWNLKKESKRDKIFQGNNYYSYKFDRKYKINTPVDRQNLIEKSKTNLKAGFKALNIENVNIDDRTKLFKALLELDKQFTVESKCGKTLIPLLFYRKYDKDRDYWNILLLLSDYEKEGKYSKFSILKYLLRIEQDKDLYSCDVFPFINYSSKKDNASFSFLWRLFRVERENNSLKKFYLGFIPFYSKE